MTPGIFILLLLTALVLIVYLLAVKRRRFAFLAFCMFVAALILGTPGYHKAPDGRYLPPQEYFSADPVQKPFQAPNPVLPSPKVVPYKPKTDRQFKED